MTRAGGAPMDFALMAPLFEKSRAENKGLTVFLPGHSVALVVTAVHGEHTLEGRNRHHGQILVRVDEIIALAL